MKIPKMLLAGLCATLLLTALTACKGSAPASAISAGSAASTAGDSATAGETSGAEDALAWWAGFDFGPNLMYAEEYTNEGDPGDYLNTAEAAKLTFETMRDNGNIPDYSDDLEYTMTLVDITEIEGEECYVYRLDVDEPSGTIGAAYAYAYQSRTIYMQGQGGEWVRPE